MGVIKMAIKDCKKTIKEFIKMKKLGGGKI